MKWIIAAVLLTVATWALTPRKKTWQLLDAPGPLAAGGMSVWGDNGRK